jgi:hypothetical protein
MSVDVGQSTLCSQNANIPCTSVTICQHGSTTNCQTVDNILVDTGSYGLRVFASALNTSLCGSFQQLTDASNNPIGECMEFGTGADWGPVVTADIQLAGETPVTTPIQLINANFGWMPSACQQLQYDTDPATSGFNGILGVGLFAPDCGSLCESSGNQTYFACASGTCYETTLASASQIQNPVSLLSADNQGVMMNMPTPNGSGVSSGSLYLGIQTQSNNTPGGSVVVYPTTTSDGTFTTTFPASGGTPYSSSFIDSGSNAYYFASQSGLPDCDPNSIAQYFFCPTSTQSLSAITTGYNVSTNATVTFSVDNALTLFASGLNGLPTLGADISGTVFTNTFDWGLPFFYNREVWVGIDGSTPAMGNGPFWAY